MINDMLHEGSSDSIENQNGLKRIEREEGTSFSKTNSRQVSETVVESDYWKYPSLSETWKKYPSFSEPQFINYSAVGPSFTREAVNEHAEVSAMKDGQFLSSQRKIIVRLRNSEDPTQATDGDEEISEEVAVCRSCFEKLNSVDTTFKTCCGCGSFLIHEKCVADWCRDIYHSTDNCDKCGKKVQKLPIILITDLCPVKSKSSKWSWLPWLKR